MLNHFTPGNDECEFVESRLSLQLANPPVRRSVSDGDAGLHPTNGGDQPYLAKISGPLFERVEYGCHLTDLRHLVFSQARNGT